MKAATRLFLAVSLASLAVASLLHVAVLLGWASAWGAMVHLLIFGWITGMIVAVNSHAMPNFAARDFPDARVLYAQAGAQALGLLLVTVALLGRSTSLLVVGLLVELLAALLFMLSIVQLLARGKRRAHPHPRPAIPHQEQVDRVGIRATMVAGPMYPLSVACLLGARLWPYANETWLTAEHLATLGWVMGMIVGVGLHILPRFSGQPVRSVRLARGQLALHVLSLLMIVIGLLAGLGTLFAVGAATMAIALALFGWNLWPTLTALRARPAVIPVSTIGGGTP